MKYCPHCQVQVLTETDKCPLCHQALNPNDEKGVVSFPPYSKRRNRWRKIVRATSISSATVILASILVNIITWTGHAWSMIVTAGVLYVWLCGLITFRKATLLGVKLMSHSIGLTALLVIINIFSTNVSEASLTWAATYAIPFIDILFIAIINILMIAKKHTMRDFLISQFALSIIGFAPLVLALVGFANPMSMSIAAAIISGVTIIGCFLFAKKIVISELARKFHV